MARKKSKPIDLSKLPDTAVLGSVSRDLRCVLTSVEFEQRAHQLATMEKQSGDMKIDHKKRRAEILAEKNEIEGSIRRKARDVRTKTEERAVECEWRADFKKNVVELIRTDSGDTIDTRKLTDEDRQRQLDL